MSPSQPVEQLKGIPLDHYRLLHSTAHIMAAAVRRIWPDVKFTVGPPIARPYLGFYYDMDLDHRIGPDDLSRIEEEMTKIVKEDQSFTRSVMGKLEALEFFRKEGQDYKLELIETKATTSSGAAEEGVEGDSVTIYQNGEFTDLCKGPHMERTGLCQNFKLLSSSGSYLWGDSSQKQIQRLYGIAWPTRKDLRRDIARHDSAAERDHRKIGRDLKLFQHHPEAPGTIFWLPKGTLIYNILSEKMGKLVQKNGYQEVRTPLLYHKSLWETSGHWEKFRDKLFLFGEEDQCQSLKPMNCPAHMLIYRSERRSYRELPLRFYDRGVLHRREDSGAVEGIRRSFQFCQDDAHIFLRPDQVDDEITRLIAMVGRVYDAFGIEFKCYLSTSDWEGHPERWLGTREVWDRAEKDLARALEKNKLDYQTDPNEAAFYGPKIDFITPNVFGVFEHQCATIQLDFNLPERFDLKYTDTDNTEKRPIVVHRVIYGSFERFIASVVEQTMGKFPVWLAPVQVKVLTISEGALEYGQQVYRELDDAGIRTEFDDRDDKISFKIRAASKEKVPYILVVGGREAEKGTVNVRAREDPQKKEEVPLSEFLERVQAESKMEF